MMNQQAHMGWPVLSALFRIIGKRVFLTFCLVSFLVVFLLAAVNVTSRHAMQRYVDDQVTRVPWDVSVYQTADVPQAGKVHDNVARTPGVAQAERLYFLRTIPPYSVMSVIDAQQLRTPWLSILTATDPSLIPPDIRPSGNDAVVVLVGSKGQMGDAFLKLQNRKTFELVVQPKDAQLEVDAGHKHPLGVLTIRTGIERVIRIDSTELNRWYLEQTSSPTLVPELGMILVLPWDPAAILKFDAVSRGFMHEHGHADIHGSPGEYFPEIIHLARLDRRAIVSGWDIEGSLTRIIAAGSRLTDGVLDQTAAAAVDHNLGAMFIRMNDIAQKIALISLLVSLPLLLMAGVLLANLSGLLMLNERRKLGLLRLRGAPGRMIGRTMLIAIAAGGLIGGLAGALAGTLLPLLIYYGGLPAPALIAKIQDPRVLAGFVIIGVFIALMVGRRFVREASRVSPLQASRRVEGAEFDGAQVRFGPLQALALVFGATKVAGWIANRSLTSYLDGAWVADLDRTLDFVAFPLFIYGLVTLIASRKGLMAALMAPVASLLAGPLKGVAVRHMEIRRHRAASFLLIVGLMASLALYPTVMTAVFDDKTERGARIQLGSDLQLTINALDLMPSEAQARGGLRERLAILREKLDPLIARLEAEPGVRRVTYLTEGLVEGLFMPDRGFAGLPIYLVPEPARHLEATYSEPTLGQNNDFSGTLRRLNDRRILASAPVGAFYKKSLDEPMPVGRMVDGRLQRMPYGGSLLFLPGAPLRTVNDREGFVAARVDYLNHLFTNAPYLIGAQNEPALADLDVLVPRVIVSIAARSGADISDLRRRSIAAAGLEPLDVRDISSETARLGSDMYIYLARQNVQIYLLGGFLLALIGIYAVAYANYLEDRRTLGLLRIRGAGPADVVRFFLPNVLGPSIVGLVIGGGVALLAGFGITKLIWELRQLQTVLNYLPTRLAVSWETGLVMAILALTLGGIVFVFARWIFAKTARQGLLEG
ncbi:MAG: FtsX-like permease family protein [Beijerinckiaceae bacterium]